MLRTIPTTTIHMTTFVKFLFCIVFDRIDWEPNGRRMARLTRRLTSRAFGGRDARSEGYRRTLKGLREGDYRELSLGLALAALAYLRDTAPRKQLLYRKTVPTGSAIVVHHKKQGAPKLEIVKPKRG